MIFLKPKPEYISIDDTFKPLPKHGHLSEKTPKFAAAEPAIDAVHSQFWASKDWAGFREAAGDPDAAIPSGGPDRYRDVVTELIEFPARDGHMVELKVYRSPKVRRGATLMYRMHGGGMDCLQTLYVGERFFNLLWFLQSRLGSWTP